MSLESGAIGALIAKYGWLKLFTLIAALGGAGIMAIFRPPKTRKEVILQGLVAIGGSIMFGGVIAEYLDYLLDFIDLSTAPTDRVVQFQIAVHGVVGALSWGIFGGLAHFRDKFSTDPVGAVKDAKDIIR